MDIRITNALKAAHTIFTIEKIAPPVHSFEIERHNLAKETILKLLEEAIELAKSELDNPSVLPKL